MNTNVETLDLEQVDLNTVMVRFGVAVMLRDGRGRLLLEKRRDDGCWGPPGGRVEPGESIVEAAMREVLEETGLTVRITKLIGVYSDPSQRLFRYLDNGDTVHKIDAIVEGEIVEGTPKPSRESETLSFFDATDLPENITRAARHPLKDYLAGDTGTIY